MTDIQKIHFTAIGESVIRDLAIAVSLKGDIVTGSDDNILEPSRSKLSQFNLLPSSLGWFPEKINVQLNSVIRGIHAHKDNPELLRAKELGIPIYSYPEYIAKSCADKQRIVIGGSHGKATITALVVHVLNFHKRHFNYVIDAPIGDMESTVKLTDDPIILIEGDECLCSALDTTPQFLKYKHHMALISGVARDHVKQFELLANRIPKGGTLIYNAEDSITETIGKTERPDVQAIPYRSHEHIVAEGTFYLTITEREKLQVHLFGKHNMQNISAAKELLKKIGITANQFYEALPTFKGMPGRLELVFQKDSFCLYKDFAHAPSKIKTTCEVVKDMYPTRILVGCLELCTFNSLNKGSLPEYKGCMNSCDEVIVYFNPTKGSQKKPVLEDDIKNFLGKFTKVFTSGAELEKYFTTEKWRGKNLLLTTPGNFDGLDINQLFQNLPL